MINKKNKIYTILRGLKILKNNNNLGLWEEIKFELLKSNPLGNVTLAKFFFSSSYEDGKIAIHQYCIDRMVRGLWLDRKIIIQAYNKDYKISWPATKAWLTVFDNKNIRMNTFMSRIYWAGNVMLIYIYNIFNLVVLLYKTNPFQGKSYNSNDFYYFINIYSSNIPKKNGDKSYTLINWFLKSKVKDHNIHYIYHNVKKAETIVVDNTNISYASLPFERALNYKCYLKLLSWVIKAVILTIFDLLLLRWHHAVMLLEAAKLKVVELTEKNNLAKEYFFHWSMGNYRPLWTYGALLRGSRSTLYFYSTVEFPTLEVRKYSQSCHWWLLNWPHYLCWTKRQAQNIIKNNSFDPKISVTGPIWFHDSGENLNLDIGSYVAVFSIEFFRKTLYIGLTSLTNYFEENLNLPILFLKDIQYCSDRIGIKMLHKRKRPEIKEMKRLVKALKDLSKENNYLEIETTQSIIRIINGAKYVICAPFTSVGFQAQAMGSNVAFYDPLSWISKNDPASNGIPILHGRNELLEWMGSK